MSSTILVTGGSGFIGTHLCRELTRRGNKVRVLDINAPKTPVNGVEYIRGDVRNTQDLAQAVSGVDHVYHFAAIVSVPVCQQTPLESYQTNLMGTANVAEAVRTENKKRSTPIRILFAGSSVVYGDLGREGVPLSEDGPTAYPPSFYGSQKLSSEHVLNLYHREHKLPSICFRFFNVYGPGQDPSSPYSGVISIFVKAAQEGRSLRLNGGGIQTRDFISVLDLARACANALDLPLESCDGRAFNLGLGKTVTIRQLAETVAAVSGKKLMLEEAPARAGDVLHSMANNQRARTTLRWTPEVELHEGLKQLFL